MLTDYQWIDIIAREAHRGQWTWNDSPLAATNNAHDKHSGFIEMVSPHHRGDAPTGVCIGVVSTPAFSPNLPTPVQAASSGEPARRNVNTGRPISLIGPIRSNARHSPTYIPLP